MHSIRLGVTLAFFFFLTCSSSFAVSTNKHAAFVTPTPRRFGSTTFTRLAMSSSDSSSSTLQLDPSETALVLIEFQNEFTTEGGKLHEAVKPCMDATNMLANSKKILDKAREVGATVIHVPIAFEKGHNEISSSPYGILSAIKDGQTFPNGEWSADFCETMKPAEGELICKGKSGLCGFHSTNLDFLLRQNNAKNVVIGGFLTNCCVESTMRTAYEHGYKVYTLKDCTAATSVEAMEATLAHNFGMFSVPSTSNDIINALTKETAPIAA